ncbi:MAG: hypothetical protein IPN92_10495 [Chromatiaceae bacterium]|nr:hypothetical protein [Chromatiaceae bacterium]
MINKSIVIAIIVIFTLTGCAAGELGWNLNKYEGKWFVVDETHNTPPSGNHLLQLEVNASRHIKKFVEEHGRPDYIMADSGPVDDNNIKPIDKHSARTNFIYSDAKRLVKIQPWTGELNEIKLSDNNISNILNSGGSSKNTTVTQESYREKQRRCSYVSTMSTGESICREDAIKNLKSQRPTTDRMYENGKCSATVTAPCPNAIETKYIRHAIRSDSPNIAVLTPNDPTGSWACRYSNNNRGLELKKHDAYCREIAAMSMVIDIAEMMDMSKK